MADDMIQLDVDKAELKALDRALRQLPGRVARTTVGNATRSGAAVIRKHVRRFAPKLTGQGRKHIIYKRVFRSMYAIQYGIGADTSVAYYLNTFELGGAFKVKGGTRFQPAIPFLRPGLRSAEREAVRKVADMLWTGIRRHAQRLRR